MPVRRRGSGCDAHSDLRPTATGWEDLCSVQRERDLFQTFRSSRVTCRPTEFENLGNILMGSMPEVIPLRREAAPAHLTSELNMPGILGGRR